MLTYTKTLSALPTIIFLVLLIVDATLPEYVELTETIVNGLIFLSGSTLIGGLVKTGNEKFLAYKEKCVKKDQPS